MRHSWKSLLLLVIIVAGSTAGSMASPNLEEDLCGNWQRACAELWGNGSKRWRACMGQPQAIHDCQGSSDVCGIWHVACVRLYGWSTSKYRNCMRQPQALRDCGLH
jgi:hypothetical protein